MTIDVPEPKPIDGITTKVVRSSAWMYGRGIVTSIINLGIMAILSRTLSPTEFGLVALAYVILRFISILATDGVSDYVIYDNKEGREERAQAAFWMDLALSSGVALLGGACIPIITRFYTEPGLGWVLAALLLRYPIDSMAAVPDALIKKSLNFQKLVIRDTFLEIATGLASVILALTGFGVWSLVLPGLFLAPLRVGMVMLMARWMPRLPLRIPLWRSVFHFSINIIGANLANTISAEGDTLIIGKTLGVELLGLYNLAWQGANLVGRNVTSTIGKLAMPALSAVSQDKARLRQAFNRMLRLLAIVSFPLLMGLFVVADLFVLVVYGPQWQASILPLRILIIFALRQTVGSPASVIYNVVGRPDLGMKFGFGFIPFYLLSIWLGSFYGIVGVAAGVTLVRTIGGIVTFWLGARLVNERLLDLLKEFTQPLIASLIMATVIQILRLGLLHMGIFQVAELLVSIIVGGMVYLLLLVTLYRNLLSDLLTVVESLSVSSARRLRQLLVIA
ncbi:MAG: lipopolysaccharide biosynthesis protein [Anaerolineales bacterium]|nr:lipopolysaccharide biosynthesis protein [Anaerolineales bacterium]